MTDLELLKFNLREDGSPYFTNEELQQLLDRNGSVQAASHEGLIMKAEDDSIKLPGLDIPSSQKYYRRLAMHFRPSGTRVLQRIDR